MTDEYTPAEAPATERQDWLCEALSKPNISTRERVELQELADLMADKTIGMPRDPVATVEPEPATEPELATPTPTPTTTATTATTTARTAEVQLDELEALLGPTASEPPRGKVQRGLDDAAPAVDTTLVTRIANATRSSRLYAEEEERESHPEPPSKPKWTRLPWDVFRSSQFLALDQRTQLLLVQVSHEVWRSNGFIKLTDAELGRWGWRGHSTGQKAIREAVAFKFLRITKRGNAAARMPTFYFPTWVALSGEKIAPNTWKTIAPKVKTKKRNPKPAAATPITKAA